jgi:ABC-2 type transport system ATP-binding protein
MGGVDFGTRDAAVEGRLSGVTVSVPAGSVTAVVGGDGAGKTTLLRLLVGALAPDRGAVLAPSDAARIGYVPTGSGYYPDLTVEENLRFAGTGYGLDRAAVEAASAQATELTGLSGFTHRLARDLSGGMRQKLALALGTLHRPDLLVLDEPTTGVDPVSRATLWQMIARAASRGAHVVVATSYIDEAERAAEVVVLHEGSTLLVGPPRELAAATPGRLLDVAEPVDRSTAWRRGARWRQWLPGPDGPAGSQLVPTLEDAVIVATLSSRRPSAGGAG